MSEPSRYVSVVPTSRLKKLLPPIASDVTHCLLCPKGFASDIALRNHARVEHIDAYATGNPAAWTSVKEETITIKQEPDYNTTEQVIFEVEPANITMLASQDVSYIIIKNEEDGSECKRKRTTAKGVKVNAEKVVTKKKKEAHPITGPFECLQPSTLVADGICHQIFFSCCEYSLHHRDEHSKRRKAFRCQVCEKPLACSGDTAPSPFACEICGEGFESSEDLAGHTAIAHIKVKPFECSICHKRFTQQGGVLQHMRMHTGDRPYPCTFCPKSFTQKSGLDQHLRTHTKVKPYQCIVCKKSFCQSVHLRQHMRTHTNVAPFQCGICEKRFKQSNHLNCHLRTHNPATMSDEQRDKYRELIGEINMSHMEEAQPNTHYVETEIQVQTIEQTDEYEPAILELWAEEKSQNIIEEAEC